MRYIQPYGIDDPDASYINGDPSIARQGSIPPAEAFEHPMRELVNVITDSVMTPTDADLEQVAKAVRSQRMNYADDTGSASTLSVAFDPPITSYTIGFPIRVKVAVTNTGPSTIDAGAGRVPIKKPTGADTAAGDLPAGGLADLVYDGTNFQMINFGGAAPAGPPSIVTINIPYTVDTGTPNTVIANFSPAITTLAAGLIVMVKIANTNTTFANININGLGLKAIYAQGGTTAYPLLPCDLVAGDVLVFVYDGTRFWIYANTILNINVGFTVANNTAFSDLFFALGRKRILSSATVTITMATGLWNPIWFSHPNADNILIQGTMIGAVPTLADYAHTGSSSAARAADSANNIAMLRARYGTEIRTPNSTVGGGINPYGGGQFTITNVLVTGDNVQASLNVRGVNVGLGVGLKCTNVAVWGIGNWGFYCGGGTLVAYNSTACACTMCGWYAAVGGRIDMWQTGCFGHGNFGIAADREGVIAYHVEGSWSYGQVQSNAVVGAYALSLGHVGFDATRVTGNGSLDLYALGMGNMASSARSGGAAVYTTTSPAVGVEGNGNSIINSGT